MQSTDQQTSARFGPVDEIAAFLMKQPLLSFGRALFGDDSFRLTFDGPWPVTDGHGSYLAGLLTSMQAVAATPAFDQPILRATLYRQLAVSVLSGFRLQGDAVVRRVTAEGRLRRYRIAAQFIDDYVSLPITVEDAAQAAGVSTSDLDQIFRGHSPIGQGVRAHLRLARLAAAHTDLINGDPTTGDTVRDIAHRWGFADPSTFAKHYRRLYGVSPKWVLDR
jgi:AraC-like DNA-binding protein